MADKKTSLIVRMTDGADGVKSKSITNVNPDATLAELKTLAQGLVSLTDRSYVGSTRIEQTDTSYVAPTPQLPYAKASFWFGSTKIADQDDSSYGNLQINFDVTQSGVTHENGVYKFFFFIKDIFKTDARGQESHWNGLVDDTGGVMVSSREHYTTSTTTPDTSNYLSADAKAWLGCVMDGTAMDMDVRTDRPYNLSICVFYEIPDSVVNNGYEVPRIDILGSAASKGWTLRFKLVKGNA